MPAQVCLGTELSFSVGPVGRTAKEDIHASRKGIAPCYAYAHSKGLFMGMSLEAGALLCNTSANEAFYGAQITPRQLLRGIVEPPQGAQVLYNALDEVVHTTGDAGPSTRRAAEHRAKAQAATQGSRRRSAAEEEVGLL